MSESVRAIAEEMIRFIQNNRTTINGLSHGRVIFDIYRGTLVDVTASESLKLSAGIQLCPLALGTGDPDEG